MKKVLLATLGLAGGLGIGAAILERHPSPRFDAGAAADAPERPAFAPDQRPATDTAPSESAFIPRSGRTPRPDPETVEATGPLTAAAVWAALADDAALGADSPQTKDFVRWAMRDDGHDRALIDGKLPCAGDVDADGEVSGADLAQFVDMLAGKDPGADFDLDGQIGAADIIEFVSRFDDGC